MVESLRGELFGTAASSPLQGLVTLLFLVWPFISLPLLVHLWRRTAVPLAPEPLRFTAPRAGLVTEVPPMSVPGDASVAGDVPGALDRRRVVERLVGLLEGGTQLQRLQASSLLADMGCTEAVEAMLALDEELTVPSGRPPVVDLTSAARAIVLDPAASADLRRVALDVLAASGRSVTAGGTPCRRRISGCAPAGSAGTRASCP